MDKPRTLYIRDQLFLLNKKEHKIRASWRTCKHCGIEFPAPDANIRQGYGLYCSHSCRAKATDKYDIGRFTWKGGEIVHWGKYHCILQNGKYIRRSRLVMQDILGRELKDDEIVHHINGDSLDDRPENLRLTTRSQHIRYHNLKRYRGEEEAELLSWEEGDNG